jgi:leucyl/phenylalanyl-tRNA--protein transferase
MSSYVDLHLAGFAHSLEVWQENNLVGGLYGILVGNVFCGESMFSLKPNASKIALVQLAFLMKKLTKNGFIDCQIQNDHLMSMGSVNIPRKEFLSKLKTLKDEADFWPSHWQCIIP